MTRGIHWEKILKAYIEHVYQQADMTFLEKHDGELPYVHGLSHDELCCLIDADNERCDEKCQTPR